MNNNHERLMLDLLNGERIFEPKLFKYLLYKVDLSIETEEKTNPIMYLLLNNKSKEIHLSKDEIYELLKKVDLNKENTWKYHTLGMVLWNNENENLFLTNHQIKSLLKKSSNESQWKAINFFLEKINRERLFQLRTSKNNDFHYQKMIHFLLYDYKFIFTRKMFNELKNKEYINDISIMIEKRNIWLHLNQDLRYKKEEKMYKL
jgi:hypothetical protein